jgi:hypothetical protein
MIDLEKMEKLATDWRANDKREHVAYIADDLAAMLRAVLPVVKAAGMWFNAFCARLPGCDGSEHDPKCPTDEAHGALYCAAKTLRRQMQEGE